MIGYNEKVNKIIIKQINGKNITSKLGVYGLNICGDNYTYYDTKMILHIINMDYVKEVKLYYDNNLIGLI